MKFYKIMMNNLKTLIFLVCLVMFAQTFKKKSLAKAFKKYKIMLLGDVGQFEEFQEHIKDTVFHPEEDPRSMEGTCKTFIKEKKAKMMINFQRVLKVARKLQNIDEAVILGDMVYTEVKGLGMKTRFNKSKNEVGLSYEERVDEYKTRLYCGWLFLTELLYDKSNPRFLNWDMSMVFGNHSYDVSSRTEAYFMEQKFNSEAWIPRMSGKISYKYQLTERDMVKPRITEAKSKDFKILYLNLDPSLLMCSHELVNGDTLFKNAAELTANEKQFQNFSKCLKSSYFTTYPGQEFLTTRRINSYIRYAKLTMIGLDGLKNFGPSDWRIVRMHQPIFNPEFDFYGIKNNKLLMKKFKEAHIHMFFTSHNHSGQIDLALYEDKDYSYQVPGLHFPGKGDRKYEPSDPIESNKVVREVCVGDEDAYYDKDGKIPAEKHNKSPTCVNRAPYWLKEFRTLKDGTPSGTIYINQENKDIILQILIGNGGRVFDPLFSDKFSDFLMLYGYTGFNRHGYATATFTTDRSGSNVCRIILHGYESADMNAKMKTLFVLNVVQLERANQVKDRKDLLNKNFKVDILEKLNDKFGKVQEAESPSEKPAPLDSSEKVSEKNVKDNE